MLIRNGEMLLGLGEKYINKFLQMVCERTKKHKEDLSRANHTESKIKTDTVKKCRHSDFLYGPRPT